MEQKTQVRAEAGKHDLWITREFDLPVSLLFLAHTDPDLFTQWMSHEYGTTRMVTFDGNAFGKWRFETSDPQGNLLYAAQGTFHAFEKDHLIVRTFEAVNGPFGVQLEYLGFESLSDETSKLTIQSIFKSSELRDALLKLPFAMGMNMAHQRLQDFMHKYKSQS